MFNPSSCLMVDPLRSIRHDIFIQLPNLTCIRIQKADLFKEKWYKVL